MIPAEFAWTTGSHAARWANALPYVDAGPLHVSHVRAEPFASVLNDCRKRYSMRQIAVATGISRYELTRISTGQVTRIRRATADTLRAVLPALLPSETP